MRHGAYAHTGFNENGSCYRAGQTSVFIILQTDRNTNTRTKYKRVPHAVPADVLKYNLRNSANEEIRDKSKVN